MSLIARTLPAPNEYKLQASYNRITVGSVGSCRPAEASRVPVHVGSASVTIPRGCSQKWVRGAAGTGDESSAIGAGGMVNWNDGGEGPGGLSGGRGRGGDWNKGQEVRGGGARSKGDWGGECQQVWETT